MKNKLTSAVLLLLVVALAAPAFASDVVGRKKPSSTRKLAKSNAATSGKVGDAFLFNINNIAMPMNNTGVMGDVTIGNVGAGQINGIGFLFSGGFFISGNAGNEVWAAATATASRIEDFLPGRVIAGPDDDPQLYVVDGNDAPFGDSWQAWADAVKMGADFYDGDGDGAYNPLDKNGNGAWDRGSEDRPDLVGDQTAWCVYNDAKRSADRTFIEAIPRGIEIQQSVFGFRSAGPLGSMIFLRYRLINRGTNNVKMDSCFFAVWADPDLGEFTDDLVGSDIARSGGYTWNDGADNLFGDNPPCFFIDFFQGPIAYIAGETYTDVNGNGVFDDGVDTPLTTASNVRGQVLGVQSFPGARNQSLSSFVNYIQGNPDRGDPNTVSEARGYMLGRLKNGARLDPCNDQFGAVMGVDCNSVPKEFWYSGNVQTNVGWIYTTPGDVRQMQNAGPFTLEKDRPVDIVAVYIAGRGTNARTSVAESQRISDFAQFIYDGNFITPTPPPAVNPIVKTTESTIELIWDTAPQVNHIDKTVAWDVRFQGYEVYMYRSNSTAAVEGGVENARLIARFDLADNLDDILVEDGLTGTRTKRYLKGTQLNPAIYGDSQRGRISVLIDSDPFTGGPLIKGKPYFFAITSYALNRDALVPVNPTSPVGNYYLSGTAIATDAATVPAIINAANNGIRPGIDLNDPFLSNLKSQAATGNIGDGTVAFTEINKNALTGHEYRVNFVQNPASAKYQVLWSLTDVTTNTVKLEAQSTFDLPPGIVTASVADGILVNVQKVDPALKPLRYSRATWYKDPVEGLTGVFYTGNDLSVERVPGVLSTRFSALTKAPQLRRVEIRFGPTQKAYRYVANRLSGYSYGADSRLALPDSLTNRGKGYVDVPFQVWIKDAKYGEERQLACAIVEGRPTANGIWDPGTDINRSREYIVIFRSTYTGADTSIQYTGGVRNSATGWADPFRAWNPPAAWGPDIITAEQRAIAQNPWFDALYAVGLERKDASSFYTSGDVLAIEVAYPFLASDVFTFKSNRKGEALTEEDKLTQFQRVNVFPNPLYAFNPTGSAIGRNADDAYVTFSNLPQEVAIHIYSLSGNLVRTLDTQDKTLGPSSPFLDWDLENEQGLRVASGLYIARVVSPSLGEKVLKFVIIMPQKQIQRF